MSGWHHDNPSPQKEHNEKVMDYFIDQGRIYADFRHVYGVNLNEADMHWWEFQWMLWNMPDGQSSFMNAIRIRTQNHGGKQVKRNWMRSAEENQFMDLERVNPRKHERTGKSN